MGLLRDAIKKLAPPHQDLADEAAARDEERRPEVDAREAAVADSLHQAQATHASATILVDRMGLLLAQARREAEAMGGPPMPVVMLPKRRRSTTRRNLCASSH